MNKGPFFAGIFWFLLSLLVLIEGKAGMWGLQVQGGQAHVLGGMMLVVAGTFFWNAFRKGNGK